MWNVDVGTHDSLMSYGMAVLEGAQPSDDTEADGIYCNIVEGYPRADQESPTRRTRAFIAALMLGWPEPDDSGDSPWAASGTGEVGGSMLCINVGYDRSVECPRSWRTWRGGGTG